MPDPTQQPQPAPAPAPAPAPGGAPAPATGLDIPTLAKKIKDQYPAYSGIDDTKLVHSVIQKYPVYQKSLSSEALQQIAGKPIENYGFTARHLGGQALQGAGELVSGLYSMGKDILFPEGTTEADKIKFLANKYIIDPAKEQERLMQSAPTTSEKFGHGLAAAVPLVGPWAAGLGEQAGKGDVGGALARGGTQYALGEFGPKVLKGAAEKLGKVTGTGGFSPVEALEKAGRPTVYDRNFQESAQRALPRLMDENKIEPIKDEGGLADAAHNAAEKLWKTEREPHIATWASDLLQGRSVANAIRNGVDEGMRDLFPDEAAKADAMADKLDGPITLGKANAYLRTFNAKLKSFYKMDPQARYAKGVTDAQIGAMEDAAGELRNLINRQLEFRGVKDPAGTMKDYGALKDMERVFNRRSVVYGRRAVMTMPEVLGMLSATAGHIKSLGIPLLVKYLNSPGRLIQGALKEAVPPSSTIIHGGVKAGALAGAAPTDETQ